MNPLLKALLAAAIGGVAPVILGAVDHPTGGLADALAHNPVYATAWGFASVFVHKIATDYQNHP